MLKDTAKFQNTLRIRLMKRGGPGYIVPAPDTFPKLDDLNRLIFESGALPCFAWLDGTTSGEKQIEQLIEMMVSKGAVTVNIIPDRSWNLPDPDVKKEKIKNLYDFVHLAMRMNLPINAGTEMNSFGNKIVDDFMSPEMEPLWPVLADGAYFVYGHTRMQRFAQLGYQSDWASAYLPQQKERNLFYTQLGYLIPPGRSAESALGKLDGSMAPVEITQFLENEFKR
jgi:hypothetical protein